MLAQSIHRAVPFFSNQAGAELIRTTFAIICCAFAGLAFWFGIEDWIESSPHFGWRFGLLAAIVLPSLVYTIGLLNGPPAAAATAAKAAWRQARGGPFMRFYMPPSIALWSSSLWRAIRRISRASAWRRSRVGR